MPTNNDHEVRHLKWQLKQLGKQLGKAGATIYALRNENAALRQMLTVDRGDYARNLQRIRNAEAAIHVLIEKLDVAQAQQHTV